jgi:hypothetical protein
METALIFAVGIAVSLPTVALAEPEAPVWFGGLREGVFPILEDWDDYSTLPRTFPPAIGQKLYVLSPDGTTEIGSLKAIEMAPDNCMFAASVIGLPQYVMEGLFLASAEPIQVAPARAVDPTDWRITEGLDRYLIAHGVPAPQLQIIRALEADLDGNGVLEAIVEAQSAGEHSPDDGAPVGHFSLVAIGPLTNESFEIVTHAGYLTSATNADDSSNEGHFGLLGLPDFDDDGKFEVALSDFGYEWTSALIYSWTEKTLSLRASASCGS